MNLNRDNLFSLEGKTVVLTGASGFLGRTMAETLLENGARLVALGRSDRLQTVMTELGKQHGADKVRTVQVDMYDVEKLTQAFEHIAREEARIDVIVNNAYELGQQTGFNSQQGTLENASFDQWQRHFMGGMFWPALAVQKLGARMKDAKRGSIINISTMYALVAPSPKLYEGTQSMNPPGYSAAKAAMLAFTRYVASFWGEHGIRANAILPGPFSNTGGDSENSIAKDDPLIERLKFRTCLNRTGAPHELSGALLYLASDASSYMTGQALSVDGGWTIV